jgi:hypothetical protein
LEVIPAGGSVDVTSVHVNDSVIVGDGDNFVRFDLSSLDPLGDATVHRGAKLVFIRD